ncbi:MAG: type II toxin-antitoxin system HicB family antitoxin [Pseudomonadota bacterium]
MSGCVSQGRTRQEALENAKEAIAAYLESLSAHDEAVPPPITEGKRSPRRLAGPGKSNHKGTKTLRRI